MTGISVVIRTKDEDRFVGYAIQSVIDHIPDAEIIVIDNNSTDDTLKVARQFDVDIYNIKKYTPGKALNMGVDLASYDRIVFLSAHCEITKWQQYSKPAMFFKQVPIFNGQKIPLKGMWKHFDNSYRANYWSEAERRFFFHNAFSMFDKDLLMEIPFDEFVEGKEDRLWAQEAAWQDIDFYYAPGVVCHHHYTPNGNTWKYYFGKEHE